MKKLYRVKLVEAESKTLFTSGTTPQPSTPKVQQVPKTPTQGKTTTITPQPPKTTPSATSAAPQNKISMTGNISGAVPESVRNAVKKGVNTLVGGGTKQNSTSNVTNTQPNSTSNVETLSGRGKPTEQTPEERGLKAAAERTTGEKPQKEYYQPSI